jgi:hypothetical protein
MRSSVFFRLLFVLYCLEAGVFLVLAPWSLVWDRVVIQAPFTLLRNLFLHPFFRGGISGFGLIHILWGLHDLDEILFRRRAGGATGL